MRLLYKGADWDEMPQDLFFSHAGHLRVGFSSSLKKQNWIKSHFMCHMNEHTKKIYVSKKIPSELCVKTSCPCLHCPTAPVKAPPIKIHKHCICVVILVVVVGGDKSTALNNLPAQRRRHEMRDLKVPHSRWKHLFLYFFTVPPPLLLPAAVSILVVRPGRHSVRDEGH